MGTAISYSGLFLFDKSNLAYRVTCCFGMAESLPRYDVLKLRYLTHFSLLTAISARRASERVACFSPFGFHHAHGSRGFTRWLVELTLKAQLQNYDAGLRHFRALHGKQVG